MDFTDKTTGHFIRFHGKVSSFEVDIYTSKLNWSDYLDSKLYFETVFKVEDRLIRQTQAIVKLPTTLSQVKDLFNNINVQWLAY
jgi:hypothetical protein